MPGATAVDGHRQFRFAFRFVDRGIGPGIDDDLRLALAHAVSDGSRVGKVQLRAVERNDIAQERQERAAIPNPPGRSYR